MLPQTTRVGPIAPQFPIERDPIRAGGPTAEHTHAQNIREPIWALLADPCPQLNGIPHLREGCKRLFISTSLAKPVESAIRWPESNRHAFPPRPAQAPRSQIIKTGAR